MVVELLVLYTALMLILGPGMMLYGVLIAVRQRVRLTRGKVLDGEAAVITGITTMVSGFAFTYFLWYMARYFPH